MPKVDMDVSCRWSLLNLSLGLCCTEESGSKVETCWNILLTCFSSSKYESSLFACPKEVQYTYTDSTTMKEDDLKGHDQWPDRLKIHGKMLAAAPLPHILHVDDAEVSNMVS